LLGGVILLPVELYVLLVLIVYGIQLFAFSQIMRLKKENPEAWNSFVLSEKLKEYADKYGR